MFGWNSASESPKALPGPTTPLSKAAADIWAEYCMNFLRVIFMRRPLLPVACDKSAAPKSAGYPPACEAFSSVRSNKPRGR